MYKHVYTRVYVFVCVCVCILSSASIFHLQYVYFYDGAMWQFPKGNLWAGPHIEEIHL